MQMTKKHKIFDIDYLQNAEFTEEDLVYLFDKSSFGLSLVVAMFELYEPNKIERDKILSIVSTDEKWMYKHYWTLEQRNTFLDILKKCFKNLYRYNDDICYQMSEMWLVQYGFTSAKQRKKKMMLLSD